MLKKQKKNNVPLKVWGMLQQEDTVTYEGDTYTSDMVLGQPRKGLSVVYSTDTRPCELLSFYANGVDLAILEGMYGSSQKDERAKEAMHMTFTEASQIAKNSGANELWLTHFSPSLPNPDEYINEALLYFENTVVGFDGITKTIKFKDD